jgi:hypothetical protein
MSVIDQATRKPKNLVIKTGTDHLMVDVSGATLTAGDITLDMTSTNAKLDTLISKFTTALDKQGQIIELLTSIDAKTL